MPDVEVETGAETGGAARPDANAFDLEVEGLIVDGEGDRRLLDVPALSVAHGEFTCITGPSGAGKSTLLFALAGLTPAARGTILWGGENLAALGDAARTRWRAAHVGLVFQDFLLFDEIGPLANASLGGAWRSRRERAAIESRARELLAWLGLDPADERAVQGYSGGERQRVAVARALAGDPDVFLADEPTASLDREAGDRLVHTLEALASTGGRTLIVVSHDPALIAAAGRVLRMVDGRIDERVDGRIDSA